MTCFSAGELSNLFTGALTAACGSLTRMNVHHIGAKMQLDLRID